MTKSLSNILKAGSLTTTLGVSKGGTGLTTITANNILLGNGASAIQTVAPGNTGNVLTSTGSGWASSAPFSYTLPTANTTTLGGVKVDGTTITANNGVISASATKTISNKTGAYTVVAGDLGKIINCTSGTFTVSLTAAASLGSGFTCTIWNTSNTSTDAITIDPSGAETIDGVATLILRRGEGLDIVSNGTNWEVGSKKPMRYFVENVSSAETRPTATGTNSFSFGRASVASGLSCFSLAAYGATAGADLSVAIGQNSSNNGSVTATGAGAMALGGSYASGVDSFAAGIGNNTSSYGATANYAIAIGNQSVSNQQYGVALGGGCVVSGDSAVCIGRNGTASGGYAVNIGFNGTSSGLQSLVINASTASATCATAIGLNSAGSGSQAVTGAGAMALGGSYASGTDSFAAGIGNNTSSYGATGGNSIAMGLQAKATNTYTLAFGYNAKATNIYAVAIGSAITASGQYGVGIGYSIMATGLRSVAVGNQAVANATDSYSFGASIASGQGSIALGYASTASGVGATALGNISTASAAYAFAAGYYSLAEQYGKYTFASGFFSAQGDAQYGKIVLRGLSDATTSSTLTSDGGNATSYNQLTLATNQGMAVTGTLIGKQAGAGGAGIVCYEVKVSVSNNNGTMTLNSGTLTLIGTDTVGLSFAPSITVNNILKTLNITSGRSNISMMRWVCTLHSTECTH
jgi:hypothetical protein